MPTGPKADQAGSKRELRFQPPARPAFPGGCGIFHEKPISHHSLQENAQFQLFE